MAVQYRRPGFDLWVGKIPWGREWLSSHSSILAWRIHGQRSLVGYSPWGCKESDMIEKLTLSHTWFKVGQSSVQFSGSVVSNTLRPHGLQHARPPCQSPTPGVYSNFMFIDLVMPSNHLILCYPLLLPLLIFPSIRVFSNESVLHTRLPKYWSFSFSINPSNEYSGLISFRMGWLDLLAVQGNSQESSRTPQFKMHQFFDAQPSL